MVVHLQAIEVDTDPAAIAAVTKAADIPAMETVAEIEVVQEFITPAVMAEAVLTGDVLLPGLEQQAAYQ